MIDIKKALRLLSNNNDLESARLSFETRLKTNEQLAVDIKCKKKQKKNEFLGQPNIFIRYTETIKNEANVKTNVNISFDVCRITTSDGSPIARQLLQHVYSTAACFLEEDPKHIVDVEYDGTRRDAYCLALCVNVEIADASGVIDTAIDQQTYLLLASNKRLLKPNNMKLAVVEEQNEHRRNIPPLSDKNMTLRHLNLIFEGIAKDPCTNIGELLLALESLNLRHNLIGVNGCISLSNMLRNRPTTRLSYLDMGYNSIGDKGCIALFDALACSNNAALRVLYLECNKIGEDACGSIANALLNQNVRSLAQLHLGENEIGDNGCVILFDAVGKNDSLIELNLESNGIKSRDACAAIGNALEENFSLLCLSLARNRINDEGCACISDGLDINTKLLALCLKGNQIGDDGCEIFLMFVESADDSALLHIDLRGNLADEDLLEYFQEIQSRRETDMHALKTLAANAEAARVLLKLGIDINFQEYGR